MKITKLSALLIFLPMLLNAVDFAFVQKDSPLQIVGATSNLQQKDFYSQVLVVNVATRPILRAQFGWIIANKDNEKQVFGIGYGPLVDLNIQPLTVATVGPQGATLSMVSEKAHAAGVPHIKLRLGVIYVKFEDGSEWKYPLAERKVFDQIDDPTLIQKISPKVREFRIKNGMAKNTPPACTQPNASPKQSSGFMAWLSGLFSVPTVHAQGIYFVCNPAPRTCIKGYSQEQCSTYFCDIDPSYCNFEECCYLDPVTGQTYC